MASSGLVIILFQLLIPISASVSQNPILPRAVFLPVTKDFSTLQYVAKLEFYHTGGAEIEIPTPVNLVVDLNGPYLWANFASHRPVESSSLECAMVDSNSNSNSNFDSKICSLPAENAISGISSSAEVNEGTIAFEFWDGVRLGSFAKIDKLLLPFAPNLLLKGLASDAKGVLGLGDSRASLTSQVFRAFGFLNRKFSLCLSSSNGGIFLGGGPNFGGKISSSMMYTPLIINGFQKGSYYINVKSINVSGGKKLKLPSNQKGSRISTVAPYTTLESKIYEKFVEAYAAAAVSMNLTLVSPVAPFGACFSSIEGAGLNIRVPAIDFVLQSEMVRWSILRRNSMVPVGDEVMCLAFVDGGLNPQDSVVIGGFQLEDYLLEFDLVNSMLGLSPPLSSRQKSCPGFGVSEKSSTV